MSQIGNSSFLYILTNDGSNYSNFELFLTLDFEIRTNKDKILNRTIYYLNNVLKSNQDILTYLFVTLPRVCTFIIISIFIYTEVRKIDF